MNNYQKNHKIQIFDLRAYDFYESNKPGYAEASRANCISG